ncbi:hypothetical protein [Azospirillum sp. sgz302134]
MANYDELQERVRRERWMDRERMPAELRTAQLLLSEEPLRALAPIPLAGQPDQVYVTADGCLVPVETKTRRRAIVYDRDVAQMSVYGVLLEHAKDERLEPYEAARYGYLRLVLPERVQYVKVPLASEEAVAKMWLNHWWFGSIGPRAGYISG